MHLWQGMHCKETFGEHRGAAETLIGSPGVKFQDTHLKWQFGDKPGWEWSLRQWEDCLIQQEIDKYALSWVRCSGNSARSPGVCFCRVRIQQTANPDVLLDNLYAQ